MLRKLLLCLAILGLFSGSAWASGHHKTLDFKVWREGSPMGSHEIVFTREGNRITAVININLEVKLGPLTLFKYSHQNREVWERGRLISLETTTDDDGTKYEVRGEATPEGFKVTGSGGTFIAPAEIMTTSYWRQDAMRHTQLLDTQKGILVNVASTFTGKELVRVDKAELLASRYESKGDLNLTLWYDGEGRWVKLRFVARGSEITYELKPS